MGKDRMAKKPSSSSGLRRRVKPRQEVDSDSENDEHFGSNKAAPASKRSSEHQETEDDDEGSIGGVETESDDDARTPNAKLDTSSVSFGALAKAQASMPPQKRRKGMEEPDSEEEDSSDQDFHSSKKGKRAALAKRTSKHAPTEMSSKRPVSRKREFETTTKLEARDPRFDPAITSSAGFDESKAKKAYAFLDEYRAGEMSALRAAIKKTKQPEEKERLQRELMSMESKKKAQDKKDRERRILEDHRREEKELVKQGKKPFYLKKSEQKKRLLTEQFQSMKKRQVDKSIERRRKKLATRERRELEHLERRA